MQIIIGVTGMLGAGKNTVTDYLVKKLNATHFSVRDFLTEEIKKRGLPVNRDTMTETSRDLSKKLGSTYLIEIMYKKAVESGQNAVIESIRQVDSVDFLFSHGAHLVGVDADPKIRYERIVSRRSATDKVSFEKFLEQEKTESAGKNPWEQNLTGCIARAEIIFQNNGTVEELQVQIDEWLKKI